MKIIFYFIGINILSLSCCNGQSVEHLDNKDSSLITYIIRSESAVNKILDSLHLCVDLKVAYCQIGWENGNTTLLFKGVNSLSKKEQYLLSKTKHTIKLNNTRFQVLLFTDILLADVPVFEEIEIVGQRDAILFVLDHEFNFIEQMAPRY